MIKMNRTVGRREYPNAVCLLQTVHYERSTNQWSSVWGVFADQADATPEEQREPLPDMMKVGRDAEQIKRLEEAMPVRLVYPTPLDTFNGPQVPHTPGLDPFKALEDAVLGDEKHKALGATRVVG